MDTHNLIYLTELKSFIGVETGYTAQDARMSFAIKTATLTMQSLLGRNLTKNSYTETLDARKNYQTGYDIKGWSDTGIYAISDVQPIALKHFPVDTAETFEVYYDVSGTFAASTKLNADDYELDAENGLIYLRISTISCRRAIKVVYTAGYTGVDDGNGDISLQPNLPADLIQACLWQARHVYDKQASSNLNAGWSGAAGSTNSYKYVNIAAIAPEMMAIVAQYRRPKVAVI